MTLLSTLEEQKLLQSIPDEIKELLTDPAKDKEIDDLNNELNDKDDCISKLEEERDRLLDTCLEFTISNYILRLPKAKRAKFVLNAYEISYICEALDESYISFKSIQTFNDVTYKIKSEKDTFIFTRIE